MKKLYQVLTPIELAEPKDNVLYIFPTDSILEIEFTTHTPNVHTALTNFFKACDSAIKDNVLDSAIVRAAFEHNFDWKQNGIYYSNYIKNAQKNCSDCEIEFCALPQDFLSGACDIRWHYETDEDFHYTFLKLRKDNTMIFDSSTGIDFGDDWENIQPKFGVDPNSDDAQVDSHPADYHVKVDDDLKLRLKRLSVNQLASIGVVQLVDGKPDEMICPFCSNGSGDSHTGLKPIAGADFSKFHCFKCGHNFDNLDLFANHFNLDISRDFAEILKRADDLSQNISVANAPVTTPKVKELSQDELALIHSDIVDAQAHFADLPKNEKRGLDDVTLIHFRVGYIAKWIHPKNRLKGYRVPPDRRIIVPTPNHYLAALLKADRPFVEDGHKKHAGIKEIFNVDSINAGEPIIVVEGEFDAMSIWQCGFKNVLAIGGVTDWLFLSLSFLTMTTLGKPIPLNFKRIYSSLVFLPPFSLSAMTRPTPTTF